MSLTNPVKNPFSTAAAKNPIFTDGGAWDILWEVGNSMMWNAGNSISWGADTSSPYAIAWDTGSSAEWAGSMEILWQ